jgi:competence protein ComEC
MLLVLLAIAAGISIDDASQLSSFTWLLIAVASALAWLTLWRFKPSIAFIALVALVAAVGGLRNQLHQSPSPNDLAVKAPAAPSPVALKGIAITGARIVAPFERTPMDWSPGRSQTQLLLSVKEVRDGEIWRSVSGKCWLRVDGNLSEIGAGDYLQVLGEYSRLPSLGNPGEPDRSRQSQVDGVGFYVFCESTSQVEIEERGSPYSPARWIGFQRQSWIHKLHRAMGPKQGALAAAILLGAREQLDRAHLDAYLLVGMSHILVVSGANVAILAGALIWIQRALGLPRGLTFAAIAFFVVWFALLADVDAPVARAAAAMLVLLLARYVGRRVDSVQVWSAAGAAVLLINPAYLFSLGAQLSFLSVATLIEAASAFEPPRRVTDPLSRLIYRSRPLPVRLLIRTGELLRDALRTSIWVWIATTPLLWSYFGFLQWGPIILNPLLAIPFVITLQTGMLFLFTDGWIPGLGPLLGAICRWSLESMDHVVGVFQTGPSLSRLTPSPPFWWVIVFYLSLIGMVIGLSPVRRRSMLDSRNSSSPRKWSTRPRFFAVSLVAAWLLIGIALGQIRDDNRCGDRLTLIFLNVGHGTCVLIDFPGGETWVYDAGNKADGRHAARILWEALLASRKTRIDRLIVSHDDTDHYSAIPALLKRVRVDRIAWTRDFEPPRSTAAEYLVEAIQSGGVPTETIDDRMHWRQSGVALRVLHPAISETFGSDNSRSVVLEIEFAGHRVLLPGDLETPGLELVMSRDTRPYDVVMAPHHGSERSVPARFAGWARPKFVIISGDEEDRRDSTINAYLAGGARVFHTADDGAIAVDILKNGQLRVHRYWANSGRQEPP